MNNTLHGIDRFRDVVLANEDLQRQLRETPDKETFLEVMMNLGRECGYNFSIADIESALGQARRTWIERWIK